MHQNQPLFKGSLATILLKLLQERGRMYGYEITRVVKELSDGTLNLTEGALYPALHKLEADGLIEATMEEAGNRRRKYYALTKQGKKDSARKVKEFKAFLEQMENLLNLKLALK